MAAEEKEINPDEMNVETEEVALEEPLAAAQQKAIALTSAAVLEDLERQYVALRQERDTLQKQLQEIQAQLAEISSIRASQQQVAANLTEVKHQMELVETERTHLQERLDRMQVESDFLREEISRLTQSKSELATSVADFELKSKLKESEVIPLLHEKQRLQTEIDNLQAHINWLEQELQAKAHDFQRLQQETRDKTIQLQLQLDQTATEKEAAEARLSTLQLIEGQLQDKIQQLSTELLSSKQELTDLKETTEMEIIEERKLVDMQKRQLERWQQRYDDVVREMTSLKEAAAEAVAASEGELEKERLRLQEKYSKLLEDKLAEYKASGRRAFDPQSRRGELVLDQTIEGNMVNDEPAEEEPLNMADVLAKWEESKALVRKLKFEKEHWKVAFSGLREQINGVAPRMKRQREEYELAVSRLKEFQSRLEHALAERDVARVDTSEARRDLHRLRQRLGDKESEAQELAKQVQALLVVRAGGEVTSEIPTSIEEIQSQNQRLLNDHRQLSKKVADLEEQLQEDETRRLLEKKESELTTLRTEREHQMRMVDNIVQQRDLYRALLVKHDSSILDSDSEDMTAVEVAKKQSARSEQIERRNTELERNLAAAQGDVDRLNREKESMSVRLVRYETHNADLTKSIGELERELLSLRSEVARCTAECHFHKDRSERLDESISRCRSEIDHLTNVKYELQKVNTDLQLSLDNANDSWKRLDGAKAESERKLRVVDAQVMTFKAAETRLLFENESLRAEITRQGAMIESIRRIEASLAAKGDAELETMKEQVQSLTNRLETERTRHTIEVENLSTRVQQSDARIQQLEYNLAKAQEENLEAKRDAITSSTERESLTKRCEQLQLKIRTLGGSGPDDGDPPEAEALLQGRVASLTAELEGSRVEIDSLASQVATFQKMASESETTLSELRKALDALKGKDGEEMDGLRRQLENLRREDAAKDQLIKDLTSDLSCQRDDQDQLANDLKCQIEVLRTQLESSNSDLESSRLQIDFLKREVESLQSSASASQNNYERELALHAEARSSLRAVREESEEEARRRLALEEQLGSSLRELEHQREQWNHERQSIQETSGILEKRLEEVKSQNELLHSQLETLTTLVEKEREARVSGAAEPAPDGSREDEQALRKSVEELREILKFVRSENAILQTRVDTASRSAERDRASLAVAKRNLDEARAALKTLQESNDAEVGDGSAKQLSEQLLAAEERARLLGESNRHLRDEVEKTKNRLHSTEAELDMVKSSVEPLKKKLQDSDTIVAGLEAEKESLKRDLESWKERVKTLVSKFNQIDPEEHKKLTQQVEALKREKELFTGWKKTTEEESARIRNIAKNLNVKMREQKTLIDSQQKEIEKLSAEKAVLASSSSIAATAEKDSEELRVKISKMEKEAESAKTELDGANTRNDKLRERLRQFQTTIRELTAKKTTLQEELGMLRQSEKALQDELTRVHSAQGTSLSKESTQKGVIMEIEEPSSVTDAGKAERFAGDEIPEVPPEGFSFGPSASDNIQMPSIGEEKSSEKQGTKPGAPIQTPAVSLRAEAPSFVPVAHTADSIPEQKTAESNIAEPMLTSLQNENNSEKGTKSEAESSGAMSEKEMSMKEKLMEKKRKLAEAKEKKRKIEAANQLEIDQEEVKRAKVEMADVGGDKARTDAHSGPASIATGKPELVGDSQTVLASQNEFENAVKEKSTEQTESSSGRGEELMSSTAVQPTVSGLGVANKQPDEPPKESTESEQKTTVSSLMGSPPAFASLPTFGSPTFQTAPTTFGSAGNGPPIFGSAFLDIKPPGSTAPPIFSFGNAIKLPTPSQAAPPPSPFGAFGTSSGFGGFGSPNAAMASRPLFGAPLATSEQKGDDKDGMTTEKVEDAGEIEKSESKQE